MYIVHVLPVKEKKKFYKEDNFSTWKSFLIFRKLLIDLNMVKMTEAFGRVKHNIY
jgi:hypothetical protein